jgi:streptomycin 6-kinase
MNSSIIAPARNRATKWIQAWNIVADETRETQDSFLTFGTCDGQAVVLKVIKRLGNENLSLQSRDEEATEIIAGVIQDMSPHPLAAVATVQDLSVSFGHYLAGANRQIPTKLVEDAQRTYAELSESQTGPRLLHGDLHHYNVLVDNRRGWLAIDPKGVLGEREYECGASLRNPLEKAEFFALGETVETRIRVVERILHVDPSRVLRWAFAQAVLATIWLVEDECRVESHPFLALAHVTRSILGTS